MSAWRACCSNSAASIPDSQAETLQQTLEYMATMPAWKDHAARHQSLARSADAAPCAFRRA